MQKNLVFTADTINTISIKTTWPSIDITVDDSKDIMLMISGDDGSVGTIQVESDNGLLKVEQQYFGINRGILQQGAWAQIVLSIPTSFAKAIMLNSVTGPCIVKGFTGNELKVESVSGDIKIHSIDVAKLRLSSVSASINASNIKCNSLKLKSVTGNISIDSLHTQKLLSSAISSTQTFNILSNYEYMEFLSVNGNIDIGQVYDSVELATRSVSSTVELDNVSNVKGAANVKIAGVSASVKIRKITRD